MLGIKGLDELFKGIYKGSIILLAGNPGTGKTTMAAKFIYEGA
ncbi:MAG: KaiC domain-containing protein, partial [Caldisphaeraceae archaeon]|nr:KaiC domain-containing protein [Caldisphaeraceae archaeon]